MNELRVAMCAVMTAAACMAGVPSAAAAEPSDGAMIDAMRACAKIADNTARLACYDRIVRSPAPRAMEDHATASVDSASGDSVARDFGADSVKSPDRFESPAERGDGPDEIRPQVLDARERQPGVYLVTVEGGAQWLFSQPVGRGFRYPRKGAIVQIKRASLGSFLMIVDGQPAVRVRRIK